MALGLAGPEQLQDDIAVAHNAYAESVTACVRSEGFDYLRRPDPVPSTPALSVSRNAPTSLITEFGYGPLYVARTLIEDRASPPPSTEEFPQDLSNAEKAALMEVRGRCMNAAAESIPWPGRVPSTVSEALRDFENDFAENAAIGELWTQWSDCMGSAGFFFESRDSAVELVAPAIPEIQAHLAGGDVGAAEATLDRWIAEERLIVEADVQCAVETEFDARFAEARLVAEQEFLVEHGDRLTLELADFRQGRGGS